jgi:hypothetical protein
MQQKKMQTLPIKKLIKIEEIFSFLYLLPVKIDLKNKPINTYIKNKLIFKEKLK